MRHILIILLLFMLCPVILAGYDAMDPGPNLEAKAVKKVSPIYPPLAKAKRLQGKVIIKIAVNNQGVVTTTEFFEGNPIFKISSLEAAEKWSFPKSTEGMAGHIVFRFQLDKQ